MSTSSRNTASKKRDLSASSDTLICTPRKTTHWSAEKIRAQLVRSFSKLCTHAGPSPWAEIEITEE